MNTLSLQEEISLERLVAALYHSGNRAAWREAKRALFSGKANMLIYQPNEVRRREQQVDSSLSSQSSFTVNDLKEVERIIGRCSDNNRRHVIRAATSNLLKKPVEA